jgi:hypothetical protein
LETGNVAETRRLAIRRKKFMKADLRAFGAILLNELEGARTAGRCATVSFELRCHDGTDYSADDMRHFEDGAEVDVKRPKSIQFTFADTVLARWIDLSLRHGGAHDGELRVSGEGGYRDWVAGVFTRLQERVAAAEPSESWFTKHPTLTYHLMALGCGSVIIVAVSFAISLGIAHGVVVLPDAGVTGPPPPGSIRFVFSRLPAIEFGVGWSVRWLLGGMAAPWVRDWILGAWPTLDLDLGPQHLKLEQMRRNRIAAFFVLGVLPFLVQLVYDLVKTILRTA